MALKKKLSYEEQIEQQKKKLKYSKVKSIVVILLVTIGCFGGIQYLAEQSNNAIAQKELSETIINNTIIDYLNNYYESDQMNVNNIVIKEITKQEENVVVDTKFLLNGTDVETTIVLDNEYNVISKLVLNNIAEEEQVINKLEVESVKNLESDQEEETLSFLESFFESINSDNATVFYEDYQSLADNTYYDIETLKLVDSGIDSSNLLQVIVSIDYVYNDSENLELYRVTQELKIVYNAENKKIIKIE